MELDEYECLISFSEEALSNRTGANSVNGLLISVLEGMADNDEEEEEEEEEECEKDDDDEDDDEGAFILILDSG